jgi:hypothetical protein
MAILVALFEITLLRQLVESMSKFRIIFTNAIRDTLAKVPPKVGVLAPVKVSGRKQTSQSRRFLVAPPLSSLTESAHLEGLG